MKQNSDHRRLTKIVCTLGPASETKQQMLDLYHAGMNVARLNLSHGSQDYHATSIERLREINSKEDAGIAILLDTKGAEIRTGDTEDPLIIKKEDIVTFYLPQIDPPEGKSISVNYDGFIDDVQETDRILIDNGELSFDILECTENTVLAKARESGEIGSRRHINLPGADVDLPSITEKDWSDIAFAVEQDVDFLALSFIRTAEEVEEVRAFLDKNDSAIHIITKIETRQAVDNIGAIIDASDGIMVARGDLGAEVPFEQLPAIQDNIVKRCRNAGKPVIVATHMLESMKEHPIPTRAEMTDVAHAAVTRADATMLSGETASGKHPPLAVDAMQRLLCATEQTQNGFIASEPVSVHSDREAKAQSAVDLTHELSVSAIVIITRTGETALNISKFRPHVPVIACTCSDKALQKMQLLYGVYPVRAEFNDDPEVTVQHGLDEALKTGLLQSGQEVTLVSNVKTEEGRTWSIQTRRV